MLVLDTSASVTPRARLLGAVMAWARDEDVGAIRAIQVDGAVHADEALAPRNLATLRIPGLWSDVTLPRSAPDHDTVFCLTSPIERFEPGFGKVVRLG